jgi:hypothetical protein
MTPYDPIPLGVSGSVTIPLEQYVARVGRKPKGPSVLLDERECPLKKLLAEKELDIDILKEVSRGNF